MNIEEAVSWWWLVLVPAAYVTAYYGGYLASIRNEAEAWKTHTGHVLGLLAIAGLVLMGVMTPATPDGLGLMSFILWLLAWLGLGITAWQGYKNRRYKSKLQICTL